MAVVPRQADILHSREVDPQAIRRNGTRKFDATVTRFSNSPYFEPNQHKLRLFALRLVLMSPSRLGLPTDLLPVKCTPTSNSIYQLFLQYQ